jgi:hypothetical protein
MAIKPRTNMSRERERRRREKRVEEYRADEEEEERLWLEEVHSDCRLVRIEKRETKRLLRSKENETKVLEMKERWRKALIKHVDDIREQEARQIPAFREMLNFRYPWDESGRFYADDWENMLNRGVRKVLERKQKRWREVTIKRIDVLNERMRKSKERRKKINREHLDKVNGLLGEKKEERKKQEADWFEEWNKKGTPLDLLVFLKRRSEVLEREKVVQDISTILFGSN